MSAPARDASGRYASTDPPEPRCRYADGEVTRSRSPFGDGPVLSPDKDADRSRFASGPVTHGERLRVQKRKKRIVQITEERDWRTEKR